MVEVDGQDNTEEFLSAFEAAKLRALTRIGQQAEGYAKDLCPVDSGLLRNSITYALPGEPAAIGSYASDDGSASGTYSGSAPDEGVVGVHIGTNVDYAADVELGTSRQAAQPFLRPAASDHAGTYRRIWEDELKNA